MRLRIKGTTIIFSVTPLQDVPAAIMILSDKLKTKENEFGFVHVDVNRGQKEYPLPENLGQKDISAVYLRVI